MKRESIAILFGGCSSEYSVSLQSAYSVIKNLDDGKYEKHLIGINRQGEWFLYKGDIEKIPEDKWEEEDNNPAFISPDRNHRGIMVMGKCVEYIPLDFAFPVLHGKNGEDGTVQGLLQMAGIPIVGCSMEASALCMDKYLSHLLARDVGVKVPKGILATIYDDREEYKSKAKELGFPQFVKPVKAGSSFGISKVHNPSELDAAIDEAFKYDGAILFEENIEGFEVGCAVIGKENILVSPVDEIELFVDWFDYEEKYTQFKSKIHMPARIDEELAEAIRATASKLYKVLGCDSFARVDIFLNKENEIIFNEINTIPGMTDHSRFPSMVRAMGISYPELLDKLVEYARI